MSQPFRICRDCGSHLDPGERCDCAARSDETTPAGERITAENTRLTPPERAYCGAAIGADLARGRDFTAAARGGRRAP